MTLVALAIVLLAVVVFFSGLAIGGHLFRIANALADQNAYYGIGHRYVALPPSPLLEEQTTEIRTPEDRIKLGGWKS